MTKHPLILAFAAATLFGAGIASAATPASRAKAEVATQAAGVPVEYTELETQVGAEISVETTLNTVRRGRLIKYTGPALTLNLGPQLGSIDFTVPRETVRSITLITPAGESAGKGAASAPKN